MQKLAPLTPKQIVVVLVLAVLLWIPMAVFAVMFVDRISARLIALVGLVNILVMPAVLIGITRKWISKL